MKKIRSHEDLRVWIHARKLVRVVYVLSKTNPAEELYELTSQMKRAAVSVVSNIAEGAGRGSTKEFIRFLYISSGSLSELETQLLLCVDLHYQSDEDVSEIRKEISSLRSQLFATIHSLKNKEQ